MNRQRSNQRYVRATLGRLALIAALGTVVFACIRGPSRTLRGLRFHFVKAIIKLRPMPEPVLTERLLTGLTPRLIVWKHELLDLQIPSAKGRDAFAPVVEIVDALEPGSEEARQHLVATRMLVRPWRLTASQRVPVQDVSLLKPALAHFEYLEDARLAMVRAKFLGGDHRKFLTEVALKLRGPRRDGHPTFLQGVLELTWQRERGPVAEPNSWKLARWTTRSLKEKSIPKTFFQEVLQERIAEPHIAKELQRSPYEEAFTDAVLAGSARSAFTTAGPSVFQNYLHPSLAAGDVNGDGFDDLVVSRRHAPLMLLMGTAAGTFEDQTKAWGVDKTESTAALFVDLDNDGDQDLVLGRWFQTGLVFINLGSQLEDRTSIWAPGLIPPSTTTLSAADWNSDGLLDIYAGTYGPILSNLPNYPVDPHWDQVVSFLRGEQIDASDGTKPQPSIFRLPGPRNSPLVNSGGRLRATTSSLGLSLRGNTYQASWSDFDNDGDPDLYTANDFGPDTLLRNDGAAGFHNVTETLGPDSLGFGMGAAWGDLDEDGHFDLYVSNMDSKAGRRIVVSSDLSETQARNARGNLLFCNRGTEGFETTIGGSAGDRTGSRAGWAWGGHMLDIDLDGRLDVHVPNGYYTPPPRLALSEVDT